MRNGRQWKTNVFSRGNYVRTAKTVVHLDGKREDEILLSVQTTEKAELLSNYEDRPLTNVRDRSIILNY